MPQGSEDDRDYARGRDDEKARQEIRDELRAEAAAKGNPGGLHRFAAIVRDAFYLASLVVFMSTAVGSLAVKVAWPLFIEQLRVDLDVVTREDLIQIREQLNQATGEDRILRMPPSHSYVEEPVSVGEEITMNLVIGRTRRGLACNFVGGQSLFEDERGIPTSGPPVGVVKQVSREAERLQVKLQPPTTLNPGRIEVVLAMRYSCPFGPGGTLIDVYDETDPLFFQLDP